VRDAVFRLLGRPPVVRVSNAPRIRAVTRRSGDGLLVHLTNYGCRYVSRDEQVLEPSANVTVTLCPPDGWRIKRMEALSPDGEACPKGPIQFVVAQEGEYAVYRVTLPDVAIATVLRCSMAR